MDDSGTWRLIREAIGLILMSAAGGLAIVFLVASSGVGVTVVTAVLVGLAAFGRWLARSETDSETERDSVPLEAGPLFQDPEDPQAFIPRP